MRKLTIFSILMILILALSACSSGDDNTENTPGAVVPGMEETANVPVTGETLVPTEAVATATTAATEPLATEAVVGTETATLVAGMEDYPNLLSEVQNLEIVNQDCEELAEIDGVVVSRGDGNILYAIGVTGGAFELDQEVLIPWSALDLHLNLDNEAGMGATAEPGVAATAQAAGTAVVGNCFENNSGFVLNVPVDNLSQAPNLLADDNANLNETITQQNWDADLRSYWTNLGVQIKEATDADMATGSQAIGNVVVLRDVGELNLRGLDDSEIGDIQDFVVDPENGVITAVVLSEGGFLGIGEHYVLVPWNVVGWQQGDDGKEVMTLDANRDRIENAPSFDSLDALPDTTVAGWDDEINAYWTTQS